MTDRGFAGAALVALAVLGVGCESDTGAGRPDTDPPESTVAGSSVAGSFDDLVVPEGFARSIALLNRGPDDDDHITVVELDVWFAGTPAEWQQGLTAVTDLDGADGMLFAFEDAAEYQFYMWHTPMPLDIYFFDAEGQFVGSDTMEPCLEGPSSRCTRYSPGGPFLSALEVPSGSLADVPVDDSWTISFTAPSADVSAPTTSSPGDG